MLFSVVKGVVQKLLFQHVVVKILNPIKILVNFVFLIVIFLTFFGSPFNNGLLNNLFANKLLSNRNCGNDTTMIDGSFNPENKFTGEGIKYTEDEMKSIMVIPRGKKH